MRKALDRSENVYYVESISLGVRHPFSGRETSKEYTIIELPPNSTDLKKLENLDKGINKAPFPSDEYTRLNSERDEILQNLREKGYQEYRFSSETTYIRGGTLEERPSNAQLLERRKKQKVK